MIQLRCLTALLAVACLSVTLDANDKELRILLQNKLTPEATLLVQAPTVTGITMAVGKGDRILFAKGFGVANVETGAPVTPTTKMRAGSVSKVMTTALLARLLEDGQLDIDAPIQQYVPYFPQKRWRLTIRDMSAHMGGVRHYKGDEFLSTRYYDTVKSGLLMFANDPLQFEPRTQVSYSSHAWNLISASLEGAAEAPFLQAMQEHVFTPLGMADTMAEDVTKDLANLSAFHIQDGENTIIAPFVDNSYKWAGGGFIATASDLVTFGLAHTRPGYLSQETLSLLFKEQKTRAGNPAGFGIGWMTAGAMRQRLASSQNSEFDDTIDDQLVWHSGGSMGAAALLLVDPEHDIAIALMTNHGNGFPALQQLGLSALKVLLKLENSQSHTAP